MTEEKCKLIQKDGNKVYLVAPKGTIFKDSDGRTHDRVQLLKKEEPFRCPFRYPNEWTIPDWSG